ncbi:MAG: hypothetical protein EXQ63_05570, partial [Ilumatobacteraceae bacterium]|nr:hypothetical protein [Ilumatobacteraceae bacterium]
MAAKKRVYELAESLGLTNKEAVDLCIAMGIDVKSQSSSIEEAQADRVRRRAEKEGLVRDKQPEEPKVAKKAVAKKVVDPDAPVKKAVAKKAVAKKAVAKKAVAKKNAEPKVKTPAKVVEVVAPTPVVEPVQQATAQVSDAPATHEGRVISSGRPVPGSVARPTSSAPTAPVGRVAPPAGRIAPPVTRTPPPGSPPQRPVVGPSGRHIPPPPAGRQIPPPPSGTGPG